MRKDLLVYCFILLLIPSVFAQDWGLSETARSAGMGNAFSAVGDGANAMPLNPAGLYESPRHQFLMTYSKDYSGLDFGDLYQASIMYSPLNQGRFTFGLGANMFSEDVFEMISGSVALGGRVTKIGGKRGYFAMFAVGNLYRVNYNSGNFYWMEEEDEDPTGDPIFSDGYDKMTFGADVAFLLKYKDFKFGGRVANLNEPNLSIEDVEAGKLPRKARVGVSYNIMDIITPSVDYEMALGDVGLQDEATYHVGAESWLFEDAIGVRAGFTSNDITAGVSLQKTTGFGAGLDYAMVYPRFEEDVTLITHKVTVNLGTKIPPPKRYDLTINGDSLRTIPDILATGSMGNLIIPISNIELDPVKTFKVAAYYTDSLGENTLIGTESVSGLKGEGDKIEVSIPWNPPRSDFYQVTVHVDDDGSRLPKFSGVIEEEDEKNNSASFEVASFYEPKLDGIEPERTSLEISQVSFIKEELPMFPAVYFDSKGSMIPDRFNRMLKTLALRLADNKDVKFKLYGYYDLYTEADKDSDVLALNRAEAVKKRLVEFGAPGDRIDIVKKDYNKSMVRATGRDGRKPHEASLGAVAEENRRVEFQTEMSNNPVLVSIDVDRKAGKISAGDMTKIENAVSNAKTLLTQNPDVELEILSYGEEDSRIAFDRVKDAEEAIGAKLGYFLQGRMFEAFKLADGEKDKIELRYSGEPLIYKPLTQSNVPEGFKIAEERGNLITFSGLSVDAPIDTFFITVKDDKDNTFRVLAYGKGEVPQRVNWNWRSDEGEPPHPSRDYYIDFYLRDVLGREIASKSEKLTIDAQKMEHREELVLINFHFAGTSPKSDYIEARIENVAKEIVEKTENPFESMEVVIGGHTDVIGSDDVNERLSQQRADRELNNLRAYLIKYLNLRGEDDLDGWLNKKNIDLKAQGYGPGRPYVISVWERGYYNTREIGDNEYPEGRILNRRVSVEIKIKM